MPLPAPRWSLRRDRQFFTQASRRRFSHFTLFYLDSPTFHSSVIVPKTVSTQAVVRNRLKRVSRAGIYQWLQTPTTATLRIAVVLYPSAANLAGTELQKLLAAALTSLTQAHVKKTDL